MIYNMDFLISAMVILLLILWHFLGQKRAEDLNNRVFLFFAVLGTADVVAEFLLITILLHTTAIWKMPQSS
ncbi:MAG: hypothetical protein ACLR1V_01580 [Coprococcus sp.]